MARRPVTAVVVVVIALLCAGNHLVANAQDIADCAWEPVKAELACHLKSLQTGPAVIPQVGRSLWCVIKAPERVYYELFPWVLFMDVHIYVFIYDFFNLHRT